MVDAIQNLAAVEPLAVTRKPPPPPRGTAETFQQVLDRGMRSQAVGARPGPLHAGVQQVRLQPEAPVRSRTSPEAADAALTEAMAREFVPESWREGLAFIMGKESSGQIDARNPIHSARGLFQLTRANYHLNPNGEASFGNGVEEAQGGIRYIQQRYGTVDAAVAHWNKVGWY